MPRRKRNTGESCRGRRLVQEVADVVAGAEDGFMPLNTTTRTAASGCSGLQRVGHGAVHGGVMEFFLSTRLR
jgi:hypothetical protein